MKKKYLTKFNIFIISALVIILVILNLKAIAKKFLSNEIQNSIKIVKNASSIIKKIESNENKIKITDLKINNILSSIEIYNSIQIQEKKFLTKNKKFYYLKKFYSPFLDYKSFGNKPVAYADSYENKTFFVSGSGAFFFIENLSPANEIIKFQRIHTNLQEFLKFKSIFLEGWFSVKDLLVYKNKIYLSLNYEIKKNCFNTSILIAEINFTKLEFEDFFNPKECLYVNNNGVSYGAPEEAKKILKKIKSNYSEANAHQSGGKMAIQEDSIFLSVGDYRYRELAQDKKSIFGKILKINLNTKEFKIFSSGHRNPQGIIVYDKKNIFATEHGPLGGDEINHIEEGKNYGWPISSYGSHYDGKYREKAPLNKSHKNFGFKEPLLFFVPSIGISDLIKIENEFYDKNSKYMNLFVSSLKEKKLYLFAINENLEIKKKETFNIEERIRDLAYLGKENCFLMILEDSPSIGLFYTKN